MSTTSGDGDPDSSTTVSSPPAKLARQSAACVTISPATSGKDLKFKRDFKEFFRTTSLHQAFQRHSAFRAVFNDNYFSGRIVAEDATERDETEKNFTLTGARKGLISTIMTAYSEHCNLVISPDDVWLTILAQFSAYVNRNAEGLRGRIVEHEGKKELRVELDGPWETAGYRRMIKGLLGEIRKNIKCPDLADWFRPEFSTTTERDEVCAAATAMGSLKAYFEFTMGVACGIPAVTLMGTIEDWKLLREKIDRLLEFEVQNSPDGNVMELWVGYLRKVCDGFVESAEHPDSAKTLEFWDKVLSHEERGSDLTYITGWVSAFTCFDKDGKFIGEKREVCTRQMQTGTIEFPLIRVSRISDNIVSCPVKIDNYEVEYDATLFTGQVVFEAEQDKGEAYPTLRARSDWCMAVADKAREWEKKNSPFGLTHANHHWLQQEEKH